MDERQAVILYVRTGERGSYADWVRLFDEVWEAPRERLERLLALLSDENVLKAPTRPPVSRGKAAGRSAFLRAFKAFSDLHTRSKRWAVSGEVLFIEMTFTASTDGGAACRCAAGEAVFGISRIERIADAAALIHTK